MGVGGGSTTKLKISFYTNILLGINFLFYLLILNAETLQTGCKKICGGKRGAHRMHSVSEDYKSAERKGMRVATKSAGASIQRAVEGCAAGDERESGGGDVRPRRRVRACDGADHQLREIRILLLQQGLLRQRRAVRRHHPLRPHLHHVFRPRQACFLGPLPPQRGC